MPQPPNSPQNPIPGKPLPPGAAPVALRLDIREELRPGLERLLPADPIMVPKRVVLARDTHPCRTYFRNLKAYPIDW